MYCTKCVLELLSYTLFSEWLCITPRRCFCSCPWLRLDLITLWAIWRYLVRKLYEQCVNKDELKFVYYIYTTWSTEVEMASCYQNCSEKLLQCSRKTFKIPKFKAEFAKFLRSLKQFNLAVKCQSNFVIQNAFLTCSWKFLISNEWEQSEFKLEKIIGI